MLEVELVFSDVIVIGVGWLGFMVCKYMFEIGLIVVVLEKCFDIGGLWCFIEDFNIVIVMRFIKIIFLLFVIEMLDFLMLDEIGVFLKYIDILVYLKFYCDEFNLWFYICLGYGVKEVRKKDNLW